MNQTISKIIFSLNELRYEAFIRYIQSGAGPWYWVIFRKENSIDEFITLEIEFDHLEQNGSADGWKQRKGSVFFNTDITEDFLKTLVEAIKREIIPNSPKTG